MNSCKIIGSRSRIFPSVGMAVAVASALVSQPSHAANTAKPVVIGATDLSQSSSYMGGTLPTGANDVQFTAITYTNTTLDVNGAALSFGTLNDLDLTQSLLLTNTNMAAGSITLLPGSTNSTSGSTGADLLFVKAGANLAIQSGVGSLTLNLGATGNIDNAGTLSLAGPVSIAASTTTSFTGVGTTSVGGNIAATMGAINVVNTTGTVTFSGTNAYTGLTQVGTTNLVNGATATTTGRLVISGSQTSATGGLYLAANSTLDLRSATALGTGALTIGGGTIVTGSGSALTLTNVTPVTLGTVNLGSATNTGGNGDISFGGGAVSYSGVFTETLLGTGATFRFDGAATQVSASGNAIFSVVGAGNTLVFGGSTLTLASDPAVNNRGTTFSGSGNVMILGAAQNNPAAPTVSGQLGYSGTGTLTLAGANTYTGTTTVSNGTVNLTGSSSGAGATSVTGGTYNVSGALTGGTAITVTGAGVFSESTTGTISGAASTFTQNSTGTSTLAGANTYTGTTTVSNGTLRLGATDAIKSGNAVTVGGTVAGAVPVLDLGGFNQSLGALSLGGQTGSTATSGATVTNSTGNGTLSVTAVSYSALNNNLGATISTTALDLGGTARSFNIGDSPTAALDLSVSATLQNGSLTKVGAGTLALLADNSVGYAGTTTIQTGMVAVGNDRAFGTGTVTLNASVASAVLGIQSADGTAHSIANALGTFGGTTPVYTFGVASGAGNGDLSFTNTTAVSLGTTVRGLTVNNTTSFANPFTGAGGGITKTGTGTLILSGASTYTGVTTVSAGTLSLGAANALQGATGQVSIGGGRLSSSVATATLGGSLLMTSGSVDPNGSSVGMLTLRRRQNVHHERRHVKPQSRYRLRFDRERGRNGGLQHHGRNVCPGYDRGRFQLRDHLQRTERLHRNGYSVGSGFHRLRHRELRGLAGYDRKLELRRRCRPRACERGLDRRGNLRGGGRPATPSARELSSSLGAAFHRRAAASGRGSGVRTVSFRLRNIAQIGNTKNGEGETMNNFLLGSGNDGSFWIFTLPL